MVSISFGKRHVAAAGIFLILVFGAIGVYAAWVQPAKWHAMSEIEVPADCVAGQVMKFNGNAWACGSDATADPGKGDNLGNHKATDNLNMGAYQLLVKDIQSPDDTPIHIAYDKNYNIYFKNGAEGGKTSFGGEGIETGGIWIGGEKLDIGYNQNADIYFKTGATSGKVFVGGGGLDANKICFSGVCRTSWGTFIGATTNDYTGSGVGGYAGGNSKCAAQFPGTRMCSPHDFVNGVPSVKGWYSAYGSFNVGSNLAYINDCGGWTKTTEQGLQFWGVIWNGNQPDISLCTEANKILCCKI